MTLYEIDEAIMDCIDTETGEVIDQAKLDALNLEREKKIEGVACWVKNLKAEIAAIKTETASLKERQEAKEKKLESLTAWLMNALDGQKFETAKCSVRFRCSDVVDVSDDAAVPAEYQRIKTEPNKAAIKAALKAGETVPGCALVVSVSMTVK